MTALILVGGSHAESVVQVTQTSYDTLGRPDCVAIRMNPDAFASLPAGGACSLGAAGTQGPDRISTKVYDAAGQVTQVRQGVGTAAERVYSTFAYSLNGKVTDSIDANGNRTKMTYDGFDRQVGLYYPSTTRPSAFNASTQATASSTAGAYSTTDYETYVYDANGNRTEWRRRSGELIKSDYDNFNRETRQYNPNGLISELHTGYNLLGAIVYKRFGSASGSGVTYAYDGLGRVTSSTDINNRTVSYAAIHNAIVHATEENSEDDGQATGEAPSNAGDETRTPAPALPGDPYHPSEVDKRRSGLRDDLETGNKDPDSPIPDQQPGSDQGGHGARGRTPHKTGERNVNSKEEHSRRPKGNPEGRRW
jgi:YD repeat-containing protein